jgi:hypothetical protein
MSMKVHPSECPYCGQQLADCMCNFDPPRYPQDDPSEHEPEEKGSATEDTD